MPPLTPGVRAVIWANAAVFLGLFLLYVLPATRGFAFGVQEWLGISPELWLRGIPPVWQLVTWGFLHSFTDPTHILFNMLFLYFLGTMLEGIIGTRRFLAVYLSGVLVSGIATLGVGMSAALLSSGGAAPTTIGASGAVFCIVVAMAALRPKTRVIFILFPITLRTLAILYVGLNVFDLLLQFSGGAGSNVAYLAHVTGAGWGWILVKTGWIWRDPVAGLEERRRRVEERRGAQEDLQVDELLAKISREGIHSLTARERSFLKRVSKRR